MKTDCYITLEPRFWGYQNRYLGRIQPVKVGGKKPRALAGGQVVVKIALDIPEAAFCPFTAEALVEVTLPDMEIGVEVAPAADDIT